MPRGLDFGGGKEFDCGAVREGLVFALATIKRYSSKMSSGTILGADDKLGFSNALNEAALLEQAAVKAGHARCLGKGACQIAAKGAD
jgi:hypothetical protein